MIQETLTIIVTLVLAIVLVEKQLELNFSEEEFDIDKTNKGGD